MSANRAAVATELPLPEPIAQHDDAVRCGAIVLGPQGATEERTRAQHVEEMTRDDPVVDPDRVAVRQERPRPARRADRGKFLDGTRLAAPREKIPIADFGARGDLVLARNHEALGVCEWKR